MEDILISVIIPVYKVEPYLDACVRSVLAQTHKNLEVFLVDDGSPDNCPAMCDAWAEKDSRVRVIHKRNGGQGEARNVAIEAAAGEYVGFVDSDDVIAPDMYEKLLRLITEEDAGAVQCGMLYYYDAAQTEFVPAVRCPQVSVLSPDEAVKMLITTVRITSTCPNTLLKSAVAKKVLFDVGVINEDVMWIYRVLRAAGKIVLTNEQLYYYYQRQDSTMNSAYSEKRFDALNANLAKAEAVRRDYPELYSVALKNYVGSCMYHYQMLCRLPSTPEYEGFKERIHQRFRDSDIETVMSVTSAKYRMWYGLFLRSPELTCKIRNSLKIGL